MARPKPARPEAALERWLHLLHTAGQCSSAELRRSFVRTMMRAAARELFAARRHALPVGARLFASSSDELARDERLAAKDGSAQALAEARAGLFELAAVRTEDLPHALGALFESLAGLELGVQGGRARVSVTRRRKRTGAFYTPAALAGQVAGHALDELGRSRGKLGRDIVACDPACGSGAFLVETARALFARLGAADASRAAALELRRHVACRMLVGVDVDEDALAVAQLSLWAFVEDAELPASAIGGLFAGDALTGPGLGARAVLARESGLDWTRVLAEGQRHGFDLLIGNPPWVAFAGRAAQPLPAARRAYFSQSYRGFRGYPTLHALFVERALELAPEGVIALLLPSPLADLDGYRPVRRTLLATHAPREPLLEFGGDAFAGVAQPCFALVASPRRDPLEPDSGRAFVLAERPRLDATARTVEPPVVFARLGAAEPLPRELFGELGLQTTRLVSERLLLRSNEPCGDYVYPLLEGRNVQEFRVGTPRLFLHPDEELLAKARCRVREAEVYRKVRFVVRQTARMPIAALHTGLPFRNTLLAGFEVPGYPPEFVVGLLNSSLYRALHLARQRDGRQSVFPQVKIGHLRALPRPPLESHAAFAEISELTRRASATGPSPTLRAALDRAVFDLFALDESEREDVHAFLRDRAPELGA